MDESLFEAKKKIGFATVLARCTPSLFEFLILKKKLN